MATAKTKKQLVNQVLRRLREDEVSAESTLSSNPYALSIGEFLNDVKQEVEDAWNWSQLRQLLTINTTAGSSEYNLGDADDTTTNVTVVDSDGNTFVVSSIEGYDTEDISNERTQILSMWNTTDDYMLKRVSDSFMNRHTLIGTQQNSSPTYYRTKGYDSNGDHVVELYPVPDSAYVIKTWVYNPQDPLSTDTSQLVLTAAETAIIYGTWAMAISERGEDGGKLYDEVFGRYQSYLATAIARDKEQYSGTESGAEGDWSVV